MASSFSFATARDWARLGLLYLRDGVWEDEMLLPEAWVEYSSTPTPTSEGLYGAHFWRGGTFHVGSQEVTRSKECDAVYPYRKVCGCCCC